MAKPPLITVASEPTSLCIKPLSNLGLQAKPTRGAQLFLSGLTNGTVLTLKGNVGSKIAFGEPLSRATVMSCN